MSLTFGSLFAGIGGMDLGLERAGMRCVWQVEIEPYCRAVLAKHWPDVRKHDDVKTFPPTQAEEWGCDLIAGGFPCQPVSNDGHMLVQQDERWLWPDFFRVIRLLRPSYVLLENVSALLVRGIGDVLRDLSEIRYDAEWESIPAVSFGAPHKRERIFIVAYPDSFRRKEGEGVFSPSSDCGFPQAEWRGVLHRGNSGRFRLLPDSKDYSVGYGIPGDLDGIRALGNAVCPVVAEFIGRRILEHMKGTSCHDTAKTGTR